MSDNHIVITSNLVSNFWSNLVHLIDVVSLPLMTGCNTYSLLSVRFNESWIVSATFDNIKIHLLCHARVTILFHLVHLMGNPNPSTPSDDWF